MMLPALAEILDGCLRGQQHAENIDVEHLAIVILGHGLDRCKCIDPGVVDQHVEATEGLNRRFDQALCLVDLGDIALHRDGLAASCGDGLDQSVRPGFARCIIDNDCGAFARECLGDGGADTFGSSL